jgi:hypothetical protein
LLLTSISSTSSHPNIIQIHSAASSNRIHATVFHDGLIIHLKWVTRELDICIRSDTVQTICGSSFTHLEGVHPWLLCMYICHFHLPNIEVSEEDGFLSTKAQPYKSAD